MSPSIDATRYRQRRAALAQTLNGGLVALTAYQKVERRGDAAHPFVQESNFWYLTGIGDSDWRLIIDGRKSYLVAPAVSETQLLFEGAMSWEAAKKVSGVDEVLSMTEARELLDRLAKEHDGVYTLAPHPHEEHFGFALNPAQENLYAELNSTFHETKDIRPTLNKMRAIKTDDELKNIRQAIAVTIGAFEQVKSTISSMSHEYEIEAVLNSEFRRTGAQGHAYEPIVASGANACTLHYGHNNDLLLANGLVLIDAGALVGGYAADITRTYATGTPTARQIQVYEAVESAHHKIIALLGPGLSVKEYHEKVDTIMKDALKALGLLNAPDDYRKYFPHAISHGLGLDVHDSLGAPTQFEPGMVLTVEPGIYIQEEGIGVRIEDNILITKEGHENLSASLSTSL